MVDDDQEGGPTPSAWRRAPPAASVTKRLRLLGSVTTSAAAAGSPRRGTFTLGLSGTSYWTARRTQTRKRGLPLAGRSVHKRAENS